MRISPVQNINSRKSIALTKQNSLVDKNVVNDYENKFSNVFSYQAFPNINFKGINRASEITKKIAEISLEDKISVAIDKLASEI